MNVLYNKAKQKLLEGHFNLATIEAAWVEVSGGVSTVKISARTPFGTVFDTYLTHVLLEQP